MLEGREIPWPWPLGKLQGGPGDGGTVPPWWDSPRVVCPLAGGTRCAVYVRQEDGSYHFEKTVEGNDLEKVP